MCERGSLPNEARLKPPGIITNPCLQGFPSKRLPHWALLQERRTRSGPPRLVLFLPPQSETRPALRQSEASPSLLSLALSVGQLKIVAIPGLTTQPYTLLIQGQPQISTLQHVLIQNSTFIFCRCFSPHPCPRPRLQCRAGCAPMNGYKMRLV